MNNTPLYPPHAVFTLPEPAPTDFIRGVFSGITPAVNVPDGLWDKWLPTNEPQKYDWDTNECTQLSGINSVATQGDWHLSQGHFPAEAIKWFTDNGYFDENGKFAFSERFVGIMSNTTIRGNTPWAFWQAVSKYGLLPRKDLAYTLAESQQFPTQETMCLDYYRRSAVTPAMLAKAQTSLKWLLIQYEWLGGSNNTKTPTALIVEALKQAPVQIGVPVCLPGWNSPKVLFCGPRPADHCIVIWGQNADGSWNIRDHYQPYDKILSSDYYIPQAILGIVSPVPVLPAPPASLPGDQAKAPNPAEVDYFQKVLAFLSWLLGHLSTLKQGITGLWE